MKICRSCKTSKSIDNYYPAPTCKDGFRGTCKSCHIKKNTHYAVQNRNKRLEYNKTYEKNNKDNIRKKKSEYYVKNQDRLRTYMIENKEYFNRKQVQRIKLLRATCPTFKFLSNIRSNIYHSLRKGGYTKKSKTYQLLGADFATVKEHLVNSAVVNYGFYDPERVYHIDHIIPCASATTEKELLKLQHYTNLQYLYPKDNIVKADKLNFNLKEIQ